MLSRRQHKLNTLNPPHESPNHHELKKEITPVTIEDLKVGLIYNATMPEADKLLKGEGIHIGTRPLHPYLKPNYS